MPLHASFSLLTPHVTFSRFIFIRRLISLCLQLRHIDAPPFSLYVIFAAFHYFAAEPLPIFMPFIFMLLIFAFAIDVYYAMRLRHAAITPAAPCR